MSKTEEIFENLLPPISVSKSLVSNLGAELAIASALIMRIYKYAEEDNFPDGKDVILFGIDLLTNFMGITEGRSNNLLITLQQLGIIVNIQKVKTIMETELYETLINLNKYTEYYYTTIQKDDKVGCFYEEGDEE